MGQLFKIAGFLPFILIVFLNAFVDLGHKIIIQNTVFKTYDGKEQIILTAIVNALILLPFILLFTPAGFLSDKYPKNKVMRVSAAIAVFLTSLITLFYYLGMFWAAFAMTFLLAVQSAIYSPAKFGYIKELTGKELLTSANGLVQAVTMIAILTGTFVFSIIFENLLAGYHTADTSKLIRAIAPVGWFLILFSSTEFILTFRLPQKQDVFDKLHFDFGRYVRGGYLKQNLKIIYNHPVIWRSIIGLSIFWGISQVLLASFPAFAKETMDMLDTVVIQGMMACAGIGIMLGSITSGKLSKNHIETGLLPVGAIGVAIALLIMPSLNTPITHALNFLSLGFLGGLFIVPLNALIQFHAKEHELGIVLAGNNLVQTTVMLGFLSLTVVFAWLGLSSIGLFTLLTAVAFIGALYTLYNLPQSFVRFIASRLLYSKYRLHVQGFENIPESGGVLMLGNHISWIDWAILQMACPRQIHFVMERSYYERWYLKWFLDMFGVIPIARGSSKRALQLVTDYINKGEVVALFPEGMISRTGQLAKFRHGFERAAKGASGVILPFYLHGLWGSFFSRASQKLKTNTKSGVKRDLIVAFGKPCPITLTAEELKLKIFDLSIESWNSFSYSLRPIPEVWLETAKRRASEICLTESTGKRFHNRQMMNSILSLSSLIDRHQEQNIAVLLPPSADGIAVNLAILINGKTVVNLDHINNQKAILAAIREAAIQHLYTSKAALERLGQQGIVLERMLPGTNIVCLEDVKSQISVMKRLSTRLLVRLFPARLLYFIYGRKITIEQPAAILFSLRRHNQNKIPKGIVLSHRNLMINLKQVAHVLNTQEDDMVMSTLPLSRAFGLTVTTLLPLVEGIPLVSHPIPEDVEKIAKAITRNEATILCSTPSILHHFKKSENVHPLMLESLRIIVSGGERLEPEIYRSFKLEFTREIYEGYGTTETSPVASVNVPDKLDTHTWQVQIGSKPGTVGMPLPGTSFRIVEPGTMKELPIGEVGQILIGGPQVMLGYLNDPQATSEAIIEKDNIRWFRTVDSGFLDQDGFLTITSN